MPILILLIFGIVVAMIANAKGRNPVGWFFIGFFTHLVGLVLVLVLSDLNEEQSHRARMEQENRRLREQLRQERLKTESFRDYAMQRLDAHDHQLGVDTRTIGTLPVGSEPLQYLPPAATTPPATANPTADQTATVRPVVWYYEYDGETRGPVSAERIRELIAESDIHAGTLLWAEHLPDWMPARHTDEFRDITEA